MLWNILLRNFSAVAKSFIELKKRGANKRGFISVSECVCDSKWVYKKRDHQNLIKENIRKCVPSYLSLMSDFIYHVKSRDAYVTKDGIFLIINSIIFEEIVQIFMDLACSSVRRIFVYSFIDFHLISLRILKNFRGEVERGILSEISF